MTLDLNDDGAVSACLVCDDPVDASRLEVAFASVCVFSAVLFG